MKNVPIIAEEILKMLKLVDLLQLSSVKLGDYKIHCATDDQASVWRPLEQYYDGSFEWGQARQSQTNFKCEHVLSLINLGRSERWLFVGVYRVAGVRKVREPGWSGFLYTLKRIPGLDYLIGRAIIHFPKPFRACYLVGKHYEEQLIVSSILEEKMSIAPFPGFNRVRISLALLKSIIRQNHPSWHAALANVAGVYLVTDISTGKHYVGSAYGGIGLWERWCFYASSGHGGNKELREILRSKGDDYAENFQFSLVEICDINGSQEDIIARETHWKEVLMTREFGLNRN
jgi:hypothetical protein